MKPELEKLCNDYIANRSAVKAAFRFDKADFYPVCASIFCANGKAADKDRLKECRKVIKKNTGFRSKFRSGRIRSMLASMLAVGENPEERMALANDYFRLLKREFKSTEYLVLAAFLLADLADRPLTAEKAARGKELFRRMNQQHRLLTNDTDSVFAMMMAFSGKTDDELLEDTEACWKALKAKFSSSGDAQTAAQILSLAAGTPEEKVQRVSDLYDALLEAEIKYGKKQELAPLAALAMTDAPVPELTEEIREADEFLAAQPKLYGKKDEDLAERAMHAVMIVSGRYAVTGRVNAAVMATTLEIIIAKKQAARVSFAIQAVQALAGRLGGDKDGDKGTDAPAAAETEAAAATPTDLSEK